MLRAIIVRVSLLLLLFFSILTAKAQAPFSVSVHAEPKGGGQYLLEIRLDLQKGMHLYHLRDTTLGLEPVRTSFPSGQVIAKEELQIDSSKAVKIKDPLFEGKLLPVYTNRVEFRQLIEITGVIPEKLTVQLTGFAAGAEQFEPFEEKLEVALEGGVAVAERSLKDPRINIAEPVATCMEQLTVKGESLWLVFLKGLAGGLLALLMPCIFPMIPVTVSFFMNRSTNRKEGVRNGLLYGLYIFLIYLLASVPFHLAGSISPQIFNSISTNMWVNLSFFLIFVLFALSLFGLFELKLPGGWANGAGQRSGIASQLGIFFMALTLAIVSFSCTGPILGILLVNSIGEGNGAQALTAGMAGFGLALGLPFGLFALFPQVMKKLPKSGGWMDTLKVALGFIELALAIKFLSNADLVEHWGILPREVFILLWLLIALALGFYLLGIGLRVTGHGLWVTGYELIMRRGKGRIAFGLLSLAFAGYLFLGLLPSGRTGMTLLSGMAPPASYSLYKEKEASVPEPAYVNQYEEALAEAKRTGKPLLLDFTGWACVNCRKMEELVWTVPTVKQHIEQKFILVSLYVDDRKTLAPAEQGTYTLGGGKRKELRTAGDKWAGFQEANFGQVTQPMYAIVSPEGKLISQPVGYTPDAEEFTKWLECGHKNN